MPWLLQLDAGAPQTAHELRTLTAIGSSESNDIVILHPSVARHHARVSFDGSAFYLSAVDNADNAGVLRMNNRVVVRTKLKEGDVFACGPARFMFTMFDAKRATQALDPTLAWLTQLSRVARSVEEGQAEHAAEQACAMLAQSIGADVALMWKSVNSGVHILGASPENAAPVTQMRPPTQSAFARALIAAHWSEAGQLFAEQTGQPLPLWQGVHFEQSDGVYKGLLWGAREPMKVDTQLELVAEISCALVATKEAVSEPFVTTTAQTSPIVGQSPGIQHVLTMLNRVASVDIGVLITGETGTGKEVIAGEIHRLSARAGGPFVVVNCGAIPDQLIESELFGYVKGSFTGATANQEGKFQAAHHGTLFLDEIGELPLALQVKLLRALQEHVIYKVGSTKPEHVDIRVVAATHRDLATEVEHGRFREDLFYRLNVVNLHLPPLCERGDDIMLLATFFLQRCAREWNVQVSGFTPGAKAALLSHAWPGNIRELENRIKKAAVLGGRRLLSADDLGLKKETQAAPKSLLEARREFQSRYVEEALARHGGNRTRAAKDLGIDPRTIFRYLRKDKSPE